MSHFGELKKIKKLIFDVDTKTSQEAKSWLLCMEKYFELHDYPNTKRMSLVIYHLSGREPIWWEHLKHLKEIEDMKVKWEIFKNISRGSTYLKGTMTEKEKNSMN